MQEISVENKLVTGAHLADEKLTDEEAETYESFMSAYSEQVEGIEHLLTNEETRSIINQTLEEIPGAREALNKWGELTLGIVNAGIDE